MNEEDSELERLKAKRLAEMQKNISSRQEIEKTQEPGKEKPPENPRDLLINKLGFRGLEVLDPPVPYLRQRRRRQEHADRAPAIRFQAPVR